MCKGPVAGRRMEYLRNWKKASVAGAESKEEKAQISPKLLLRAVGYFELL